MRPGKRFSHSRSSALDLFPLQVLLRPAQRAGNERKLRRLCIAREIALADIRERPDHDMPAIVGDELRRHRLQLAAVEQVQEERREHVVAMMTERDLRGAKLAGNAVQRAATQPRAQRAHRCTFGDQPLDDTVGVLLDDAERHAAALEIAWQHVGGEARLFLIKVDGNKLEGLRRAPLQRQQDIEQAVAILAARQADHDAIVGVDHRIVGDRLPNKPAQALLKLVELEVRFSRVLAHRRGCRLQARVENVLGHLRILLQRVCRSAATRVGCRAAAVCGVTRWAAGRWMNVPASQ